MRQRVFLPLILLIPASALGQSAATAADGPARFGLNSRAPAFGLRVDPAPEQVTAQPTVRFAPAPRTNKEGWSAFGTMGPMRWAKPLSEDASMAWRLGGRAPGMPSSSEAAGLPKRLNVGLQYRF
jgi:hypothetical protein